MNEGLVNQRALVADGAGAISDTLGELSISLGGKAPATAAEREKVRRRILGGFRGRIEPIQISLAYRVAVVAVTLVFLLLLALYGLLVAAIGAALAHHLANHTGLLSHIVGVPLYLAPLLVGGIVMLFMVKPIFVRPAPSRGARTLSPEGQPLLFEFVGRICDSVGAPHPRRIDVTMDVNASAGLQHGLLSFFEDDDLVLTVGLPLVAGMNIRQFAGVLAHEFGHFSQGGGMRMNFLLFAMSVWFHRVAYERDIWDVRLAQWANGSHFRWFFRGAQALVALNRRLLAGLMYAGYAVGGYLARQQEFDADRYAIRLAGSDTCESMLHRVGLLSLASELAWNDLGEFYREGRLADDFAALVVANVDQIPSDVRRKFKKAMLEAKTGWFDTHPSDADRIAGAKRERTPGVYRVNGPARLLLDNFLGLSRQVTIDGYRGLFGDKLRVSDLKPVDQLLKRQGVEQEARKAVRRYLQDGYSFLRPLRLPAWRVEPPPSARQAAEQLKAARERMAAMAPEYRENYKYYDRADTKSVEIVQARALLDAGLRFGPEVFSLDLSDYPNIARAESLVRRTRDRVEGKLAAYEQLAMERLFAGLQLLHAPQVQKRLPSSEALLRDADRLLPVLEATSRQFPALLAMRANHVAVAVLMSQVEGNRENRVFVQEVIARTQAMYHATRDLRNILSQLEYPFEHAQGKISIGRFLLRELPAEEDIGEVFGAAESLALSLIDLNVRLLGRLCYLVEKVEGLFGMPRLPDPADDKAIDINETWRG